jgi:poly-beta-1,6-N-acetyl-D-glucosamine synthase
LNDYFRNHFIFVTGLASNIFWWGIIVVFYTYLGYGLLIFIISKVKRRYPVYNKPSDNNLPSVSFVVAAYNEEDFIEEKISNTLSLDYPKDKLKIIFVTDGSTDRTPEIIARFPDVQLFHESGRNGKIHAVNRVMKFVQTPIVIFTDANTVLNREAVKNIVRHYQADNVGGVAGEKRILSKSTDAASGAGEGLYWKYESFLKKKDSEVYSVVGAAGELFSVRTDLYEPPDRNMIIEDFYLSLRIASKGYRFIYEPEAYAMETASASVAEEWKRKVRICAGGFQAMVKLSYLLNPFKYGILTFQYFSHRVLRWTLAPLCLPLIFAANVFLASTGNAFYIFALILQLLFYITALIGRMLGDRKVPIPGFFVPYYFSVMNLSVYAGLVRYLRGKQSVVWERAKRA